MKNCRSFVRNNISSSFIIAFNNKEDKEEQFDNFNRMYPAFSKEVFNKIERNKKTYTEVLEYMKESLRLEAYYKIGFEDKRFESKRMDFNWKNSNEFKELEKEYIERELYEFKNSVNHRGLFSIISYSDHENAELEYYILPNMPFTVRVFSYN